MVLQDGVQVRWMNVVFTWAVRVE